MARIFISFVGLGSHYPKEDTGLGYDVAAYRLDDATYTTAFSQRAIVEHLGAASFDRLHLMYTPESHARHGAALEEQLRAIGVAPETLLACDAPMLSPEHQSIDDQWRWFAAVLNAIQPHDEVVFDFTHGFRSVPIVLSSAIGFLQKAREFTLLHAYYGFIDMSSEQRPRPGQFVDMASFYEINQWADAVGALVDSADTEPLVRMAQRPTTSPFDALRSPELARALADLTAGIKDVDVNGVAQRAEQALALVDEHKTRCGSQAEEVLFELILDKFRQLGNHVGSGRYDQPYFEVQLKLTGLLLDHGMHMQAYTIMRELIASLGMLGAKAKYLDKPRNSADGRKARKRFGELFASMAQYPEAKWKWHKPDGIPVSELADYEQVRQAVWEPLKAAGHTSALHQLSREMFTIRNGLNHGWTGTSKPTADIAATSRRHLDQLRGVVDAVGETVGFRP